MKAWCSVLLFAGLLAASDPPAGGLHGSRLRLASGVLRDGERGFRIRGVAYSHVPVGESPESPIPQRSCLYARDIPLIAAMGANTVRTYDLIPDADTAFVPLLESGGLQWLAGFPLDSFHDPARPITARKDLILASFRSYASRFRSQPRLLAYVFGNQVSDNYNQKFAGAVEDFYALLPAAAAILREIEPDNPPMLTTAVRDVRELSRKVEGLSFWSWNAYPGISFAGQLEEARGAATAPVLISEYGIDALDRLAGAEDERAQAGAATTLAAEIEAAEGILGGIYARFVDEWWRSGKEANRHLSGGPSAAGFPDGWRDEAWFGVFRALPTEQAGFDSLQPRAVFAALAALWGGRTPSAWEQDEPPELEALVNAASGDVAIAPGALVRITGKGLPAGGPACLCIGEYPAPVAAASATEWTAQAPWELVPGERSATIYRAGRAGNFVRAAVQRYAPAVFPGGVVRAGAGCRATRTNGVRPGEILEVYATGLGAGPFAGALEARVNNTPAEVLYAGLMPAFLGLNQVNLRVASATAPSPEATLELRMDGIAGTPYPLSVADPAARPSITLSYSGEEVLLQAGGPGRTARVFVGGTNGYCGPVLFRTSGLPAGISIQSPVAFVGETAPVEVRAAADAAPVSDASFALIGLAAGASSGSVTIPFTVLPRGGHIPVRVVSGGFKSQAPALLEWNGRALFTTTGGGPGRGINVLTVDPATGVYSAVMSFDTWAGEAASAALVNFLAGLPDGRIVLAAVADDGSYRLTAAARDAIAALFGSRFIGDLGYQHSWAMIGRKNRTAPIAEGFSEESVVALEEVLSLPMSP
jgi:uncharacterized protein (TIGR03437 family)